jgi:DNA polymerase III epsilon subunit-like protein
MLPHEMQPANMNGNVLVAIDVETTGRLAGFHEIVQIGIQPLDDHYRPMPDVKPFYHLIRPEYPERAEKEAMEVSGLSLEQLSMAPDQFQVADWLSEWVRDLRLPFQRSLVPLAHNWAHEKGFLTDWLGLKGIGEIFFSHPRDTMITALFINDFAVMSGDKPPFPLVNLPYLCKHFGIPHEKAHDALADAISTAELYRRLILGYGSKSLLLPVAGAGSPGSPVQ